MKRLISLLCLWGLLMPLGCQRRLVGSDLKNYLLIQQDAMEIRYDILVYAGTRIRAEKSQPCALNVTEEELAAIANLCRRTVEQLQSSQTPCLENDYDTCPFEIYLRLGGTDITMKAPGRQAPDMFFSRMEQRLEDGEGNLSPKTKEALTEIVKSRIQRLQERMQD